MLTQYPLMKPLLPGLALLLVAAPGASWAACDIIVTNTSDAAPPALPPVGSLRQAIATATSGQTICFAEALKGQTITVLPSSGQGFTIPNTNNLTIRGFGGPAANGITISGNNAARIFLVNNPVNVTFDGLILKNGNGGIAPNNRGGAIQQNGASTVTVLNSTFENNTASHAGGAISNVQGTLTIRNSTFIGNTVTATGGAPTDGRGVGGGAVFVGPDRPLVLENSTFVNNQTTGIHPGDAIRIQLSTSTTATIRNSTFSGNSGGTDPSGISNARGAQTTLQNNILTGTTCNSSVAITGNNNLINGATSGDGATACGLSDGSNGNKIGSYDPLLVALADNGGPTQTMAIPSGTPASNAGDNATCMPTDQRGVTRPQGGRCDMGAYEYTGNAKAYLIQIGGLTQVPPVCPLTPDTNYPQLSLSGVCYAQITLKNNTINDTLTDITFKVNEISNTGSAPPLTPNWILNGVNGPDQVGTIVAGPASLGPQVNMTPIFNIGLMSRNTYRLRFSAFGTLNGADITSTGERRSIMKKKTVYLGDFEAKLKPGKGNE